MALVMETEQLLAARTYVISAAVSIRSLPFGFWVALASAAGVWAAKVLAFLVRYGFGVAVLIMFAVVGVVGARIGMESVLVLLSPLAMRLRGSISPLVSEDALLRFLFWWEGIELVFRVLAGKFSMLMIVLASIVHLSPAEVASLLVLFIVDGLLFLIIK